MQLSKAITNLLYDHDCVTIPGFGSFIINESSAKYIDKDYSNIINQIAVITAEGAIMKGEISQGVAGADGIVKQIRSAHEDENMFPSIH